MTDVSPFDKNIFDLGYTGKYFLMNNRQVSTSVITNNTLTHDLLIWARYRTNSFQGAGLWKIFEFKAKRNGTNILNLIPVLDPTGKPCMFDTISKQSFYNSGTGEFQYAY